MKGGFQPASRLAGLIDEVKMEALVARASRNQVERDRAFAEIERLANQAAGLLPRVIGRESRIGAAHV